ncbi:MAG TPA: hypothetical protein DCL64_07760 [Ruminococcaceae bacterium]|jgi:hypothetical protein|nr:hypothetical protein [Oscillospiraceae bacterium]
MPEAKNSPKITAVQTLTEEEYRGACRAAADFLFPRRRRWVRVCLCLSAAGLSASLIPAALAAAAPVWVPAGLCGAFAALAAAVWIFQPVVRGRRAGRVFRSCPLMALEAKLTLTRDFAEAESRCERFRKYWTEFSLGVETPRAFIAAGAPGRGPLIVKKAGLSPRDAETAVRIFSGAFGLRFYRTGKRGRRRRWNP